MINKLKSKKVIAVLAIILVAGLIMFWRKEDDLKITYREVVAKTGAMEVKILTTGTIQPENRLEIKPPIPGRAEKVLIEEGDEVKGGQILAWMSSTERAALLDAARAKGKDELKKWEDIYPPTPILAPLDGTIVLRNIEQGQVFTSADVLLVMSDRLTVKAQVDETDIASVKLKQDAEIVLDAYPNQKIPAQVDKIAFDATNVNSVTTYIVDVLPKSVPDFMRSGMTANVTFLIRSKDNALLIPVEALKTNQGVTKVLVKDGDENVEKEIVTGDSNGKQVEVLSGLNAGDVVMIPELKLQKNGQGGGNPFAPSRGGRPNR